MQLPAICRMLHATYWANDRPDEIIAKSMEKSDCFGAFLYENDRQIGFARVISDDATFFYLCDVVVDESYRGNGVGKKLMETIHKEPNYKTMVGLLGTRDTHGLYEKYGFVKSGDCSLMRKPKETNRGES